MLIKQTIDGASIREQDIKNSIEAINSRVLDAEARADQLSPRLLLEEKARKDLGNLISLFVKRLKKVNANATELALRLSDLECRFRLKATQIEGRHILERTESPSTSTTENPIKDATLKAADGAGLTTEKSSGENGGDAICHAARAHLDWVHPNRAAAFNPPHKAGKHCSAFCSEEEGIPTSNGLFHNAPLGRSPHSPTLFRTGAADRGEYRQAAGAENARAVMNSMQKESKPHRSEPHPNSDC